MIHPTKDEILAEFDEKWENPHGITVMEKPLRDWIIFALDLYATAKVDEREREMGNIGGNIIGQLTTQIIKARAQVIEEAIELIKAPKHCLVQSCVRCEEQERAVNILFSLHPSPDKK